jgi:hypothetical protein
MRRNRHPSAGIAQNWHMQALCFCNVKSDQKEQESKGSEINCADHYL